MHTDARRRRKSDERVAAETFAADDRFEQKRERPIGELDVERKRGIEVGERLEDERDAVIALRGQRAEFCFGHDASTVLSTCATGSGASLLGARRARGLRAAPAPVVAAHPDCLGAFVAVESVEAHWVGVPKSVRFGHLSLI